MERVPAKSQDLDLAIIQFHQMEEQIVKGQIKKRLFVHQQVIRIIQ